MYIIIKYHPSLRLVKNIVENMLRLFVTRFTVLKSLIYLAKWQFDWNDGSQK